MRLTPNALSNKISELIKEGYPQKQAIAIAYTSMRIAWRDKYPKVKFPVWLEVETRGKDTMKKNPVRKARPSKTEKRNAFIAQVLDNIKPKWKKWRISKNDVLVYTEDEGWQRIANFISKNPVRPLSMKPFKSGQNRKADKSLFKVAVSLDKNRWTTVASFNKSSNAKQYAKALRKIQPYYYYYIKVFTV